MNKRTRGMLIKAAAVLFAAGLIAQTGTALWPHASARLSGGSAGSPKPERAEYAVSTPSVSAVAGEQAGETVNGQIGAPVVSNPAVSNPVGGQVSAATVSEPVSYEQFLAEFDVHDKFRAELDQLRQDGYAAADLMIAYAYLYHQFGTVGQIRELADKRKSGAAWETIFAGYKAGQPAFTPRTFASDYLESLLDNPELTADDIMIADRISFATGTEFHELIADRTDSSASWKDINAGLGILFSAAKLPRVQITAEQMTLHVQPGLFDEEQVAEAFVLAQRAGLPAEEAVRLMKAGLKEEDILAAGFRAKYGN